MWVITFKPYFGSKTAEIAKAFEKNVSLSLLFCCVTC